MDANNPLDFLGAVGRMPVKRITSAIPVACRTLDFLRGNQPFNRPYIFKSSGC